MLTLYEMSFYGAILITVIILIRSLTVNRLPKKAFLFLWAAALVRLLLPFRFSSPTSIWRAVGTLLPQTAAASINTVQTARPAPVSALAGQPETAILADFSGDVAGKLSPVMLLWLTGLTLLALFLIITHLKSRQIYCCSLPLEQPYIHKWTQECRLRHRPVQVRCSDRIESPLTYGILWPVILLPKNTDWEDEDKLGFILTHEMAHVRRFDALTKWLLAAALCIHWFNPFVWAMYVLAGRDLELSCDESVLRRYGPDAKASYALALVSLEEHRSRPAPLTSSFSKNALKERITAIMTARTNHHARRRVSAVLITAITVGVFATSAPAMPAAADAVSGQNSDETADISPSSAENTAALTDSQAGTGYTLPSYDPVVLSYTQEDYDRLIAVLKFDHWEAMSIAAFNRQIYAALNGTEAVQNDLFFLYEQIASEIPDTDPNASYLRNTVRYSLTEYNIRQQEAYSGKRLDPECSAYFENPALYTAEQSVSFSTAGYRFSYRILEQDALTVADRDAFLQQILGQADALLQENALRGFTRQDFETALKKIGAAASGSEIAFTGCSIDTFE